MFLGARADGSARFPAEMALECGQDDPERGVRGEEAPSPN